MFQALFLCVVRLLINHVLFGGTVFSRMRRSFLLLLVAGAVAACVAVTSTLHGFRGCAVREFSFVAHKPGCKGLRVTTEACWGRCHTWEVTSGIRSRWSFGSGGGEAAADDQGTRPETAGRLTTVSGLVTHRHLRTAGVAAGAGDGELLVNPFWSGEVRVSPPRNWKTNFTASGN